MNNIQTYILPALLGFLAHIFLVKLPSVQARAKAAKHPFSLLGYFKEDLVALIGTSVCIFMLLIGIDELIGISPKLAKIVKWFFFFVAMGGSSLFMFAFGKVDKLLIKIIDVKTNVSDGVIHPVNSNNKEGAEEIKKEGIKP